MNVSASVSPDLGRRLRLLLIGAAGESHSGCNEFRQRLAVRPELDVYYEQLVPGATALEIERSLAAARSHDADVVLVWSELGMFDADTQEESSTPQRAQVPRLVVDVAERVNLFDRCFVALVGPQVDRRGARRLGFEDGFTTAMPVEGLVELLMREAVARARNPGSSPPCYL
jgi:hypothetical protein